MSYKRYDIYHIDIRVKIGIIKKKNGEKKMLANTNPFDTIGTAKFEGANYRLIVKDTNGETYKFYGENCHDTKSAGGYLFHRDDIVRVCVVDITGFCFLYLVDGHPEKTVDVSSKEAIL